MVVTDITGLVFGRLTVVERAGSNAQGTAMWRVQCLCGNYRVVQKGSLASGRTRSCGCLSRELTAERAKGNSYGAKHHASESDSYHSWEAMISRCENPNNIRFHNYGGRGIRVCDRWRASFAAFLEDMGKRPSREYSIDRINNNGNYEPGNCRWATSKEQANNRRRRSTSHG